MITGTLVARNTKSPDWQALDADRADFSNLIVSVSLRREAKLDPGKEYEVTIVEKDQAV